VTVVKFEAAALQHCNGITQGVTMRTAMSTAHLKVKMFRSFD